MKRTLALLFAALVVASGAAIAAERMNAGDHLTKALNLMWAAGCPATHKLVGTYQLVPRSQGKGADGQERYTTHVTWHGECIEMTPKMSQAPSG